MIDCKQFDALLADRVHSRPYRHFIRMSSIALSDRLKYLDNQIQKLCETHQREAKLFCANELCLKTPYLCERCVKELPHPHPKDLLAFDQFVARMISRIEAKAQSHTARPIFDKQIMAYRQTIDSFESLQAKINAIINQRKARLQDEMETLIRAAKNHLGTKFNYYADPYILVNKINSEPRDNFLLELKQSLIISTKDSPTLEVDSQEEINTLVAKLKETLTASNTSQNSPFSRVSTTPHASRNIQASPKCRLQLKEKPLRLLPSSSHIGIIYEKESVLTNLSTKAERRWNASLSAEKCLLAGEILLGVNRENSKELLCCNAEKVIRFLNRSKIIAIAPLENLKYVALGCQTGLAILHLERAAIVCEHLIEDIYYIFAKSNSTLLILQSTGVLVTIEFKDESYVIQSNADNINISEVAMAFMNDSPYLVILSSCRNLLIYDVLMRMMIYKSDQKTPVLGEPSKVSIICEGNTVIIITYHTNQQFLFLWTVNIGKGMPSGVSKMLPREGCEAIELHEERVWTVKQEDGKWILWGNDFE